jgi:hypothetical protein
MKSQGYVTGTFFIAAIAFTIPLVAYAITGSHIRPIGDDYCYEAALVGRGFWEAQWYSYLSETTYNGNRYSLTLFSGIASLFGPKANAVLPGLAIAAWLVGIFFAIHETLKAVGSRLPIVTIFLGAQVLIFFTLYLAPELSQVLYWRSGMLPYLAPLIANTYLIFLILLQINSSHRRWPLLCGTALLAFLAGGFSETGTSLQAAYLGMVTLWAMWASYRQKTGKDPVILPATFALAGTLIAIAALILSPTNTARLDNLPAHPDFLTLAKMTFIYARDFALSSLRSQPVPNLVMGLIFAVLGALSIRPETVHRNTHTLKWIAFIGSAAFILLLSSMAAFAYVQSSYPEPRALVTARFVMNLAIIFSSWIVGRGAAALLNKNRRIILLATGAAAILLLFFSFYPLRATHGIVSELPRYQKWSSFWDVRDRELRSAGMSGIQQVEVVQIDHIIPRVGDLSSDQDSWYNNCAETYYGLLSISANLPGWDE